MFYKCHNCDASLHFGSFLKQMDSLMYNQYTICRLQNRDS
jgi:lysozyme family protein